jgi:phage-related protein (TIGR01555 family)
MGQSIVTPMMNVLQNYEGVIANVADMTWEAKIDVFGVADLMRKVQDPDELKAIMERYALLAVQKGVNGFIVHDQEGEEYSQKQLSFATLPDIIDRFQVDVAGASMIPRSKLFGVQTGGLGNAGESDNNDYNKRIGSMQRNGLTPDMWRLDEMLIRTALGSRPKEVHYNWRPLSNPDQKELAEIGGLIVKKWVEAVNAGIFSSEFAMEPMANELIEAGCGNGLEAALASFSGEMHEGDEDTPEV